MTNYIVAAIVASFVMSCEPEVPHDTEPPGTLEYESPSVRIYRLDRRIDITLVQGNTERRECGILSERAHTELRATLDGLVPGRDYGYDPDMHDCSEPPGAMVYVEGSSSSPFECEWYCCHPDLLEAALIYSLIESHFLGGMPSVDGEPYVAIEPDQPCP
jgi:hypothetical protein